MAGLIGVVIGALISYAGTITQFLLTKRKDDIAYRRLFRDKVRDYKREIYTRCLTELLDIKTKYYYDAEVQKDLTDNSVIKIDSQAAVDLVSSPRVSKQLKKIYDGLQHREGDIDVFEKEYQILSDLMKEDVEME